MWQQQAVKQGRAAGRVALKSGRGFLKHIVPQIVKPLNALWNEVIGFMFLCLGTILGFSAFRYIRAGDGFRSFIAASCCVIMARFGISSFWRARKISRS